MNRRSLFNPLRTLYSAFIKLSKGWIGQLYSGLWSQNGAPPEQIETLPMDFLELSYIWRCPAPPRHDHLWPFWWINLNIHVFTKYEHLALFKLIFGDFQIVWGAFGGCLGYLGVSLAIQTLIFTFWKWKHAPLRPDMTPNTPQTCKNTSPGGMPKLWRLGD